MFLIDPRSIDQLGPSLMAARKEQKLSREALSAVSGLSVSFIRDAEANAGRCTLVNIVQLISSMGLQVQIHGLSSPDSATAMDNATRVLTEPSSLGHTIKASDIARQGLPRMLPGTSK